jgi:hypothetical protein
MVTEQVAENGPTRNDKDRQNLVGQATRIDKAPLKGVCLALSLLAWSPALPCWRQKGGAVELMEAMIMDVHPAAAEFPLLEGDEYAALVASIGQDGQQEPITLHEGAILDGRNRWRACVDLGIVPRTRAWAGECGTPTRFVIAENIRRRHLNPGQAAAIAADLEPLLAREIAEKEAARKAAQPRDEGGRMASPTRADLPESGDLRSGEQGRAAKAAADLIGAKPRTVRQAKRVKEQAPELHAQVKAGTLRLDAAEKEVKRQQQKKEQHEAQRLWDVIGDSEGKLARQHVRTDYAKAVALVSQRLLQLDPDAVAAAHGPNDQFEIELFLRDVRSWCDRFEAAFRQGFRVVEASR